MSTTAENSLQPLLHDSTALQQRRPEESKPTIAAIGVELAKILESPGFSATERSRRLLEFLVGETLAGRADRIKAYTIGTTVFKRPDSFDPQKDPIVRIEAARLRRDLEHYYLTDGSGDPVIIEIPKGAYIPHFAQRSGDLLNDAKEPVAIGHRIERSKRKFLTAGFAGISFLILGVFTVGALLYQAQPKGEPVANMPGLLVKPLLDLTKSSESAALAQGLSERIIEKVSRFKELAAVAEDILNSNDPDLKSEFGMRLALLGEWESGCKLVQEAVTNSTREIAIYRTSLALCEFFRDDLGAAAKSVATFDEGDVSPAYHVIAAAILAASGDYDGASIHRKWLEKNAPVQATKLLSDLPKRLVRPTDRKRFLDALKKAQFSTASSELCTDPLESSAGVPAASREIECSTRGSVHEQKG